ncbi:unnamed protein product [Choristocarpus tenellus]
MGVAKEEKVPPPRSSRPNIFRSAESGNVDAVLKFLENGGNPDKKHKLEGHTMLHLASMRGHQSVVELLLKEGANPDLRDRRECLTPLMWAAQLGHTSIARVLLEGGADADEMDQEELSAMHWAARMGKEDVIAVLLGHRAEVDGVDYDGNSPLMWAARGGHERCVALLLDGGAQTSARDENGNTSLHFACQGGHTAVVSALLDHGAEVEAQDYWKFTPVHRACSQGHDEVIAVLLKSQKKQKQGYGGKIFKTLPEEEDMGGVEIKLGAESSGDWGWDFGGNEEKRGDGEGGGKNISVSPASPPPGVDLNACNHFQTTPLHRAAAKGHVQVVKVLLENGAHVDVRDKFFNTPLHWACKHGHKCAAELLLKHGASPISRAQGGLTPLRLARKSEVRAVVEKALIAAGEFGDEGNRYYSGVSKVGNSVSHGGSRGGDEGRNQGGSEGREAVASNGRPAEGVDGAECIGMKGETGTNDPPITMPFLSTPSSVENPPPPPLSKAPTVEDERKGRRVSRGGGTKGRSGPRPGAVNVRDLPKWGSPHFKAVDKGGGVEGEVSEPQRDAPCVASEGTGAAVPIPNRGKTSNLKEQKQNWDEKLSAWEEMVFLSRSGHHSKGSGRCEVRNGVGDRTSVGGGEVKSGSESLSRVGADGKMSLSSQLTSGTDTVGEAAKRGVNMAAEGAKKSTVKEEDTPSGAVTPKALVASVDIADGVKPPSPPRGRQMIRAHGRLGLALGEGSPRAQSEDPVTSSPLPSRSPLWSKTINAQNGTGVSAAAVLANVLQGPDDANGDLAGVGEVVAVGSELGGVEDAMAARSQSVPPVCAPLREAWGGAAGDGLQREKVRLEYRLSLKGPEAVISALGLEEEESESEEEEVWISADENDEGE